MLERSTVVCSRLEGSPDDRFRQILARQIDTPEKFLRLLALLIGFASGIGAEVSATGDGSASWSGGLRARRPRTAGARTGGESRVHRSPGRDR